MTYITIPIPTHLVVWCWRRGRGRWQRLLAVLHSLRRGVGAVRYRPRAPVVHGGDGGGVVHADDGRAARRRGGGGQCGGAAHAVVRAGR